MSKKFIVQETGRYCSHGQMLFSLSGVYFHRSDLRFFDILEDDIPLKLLLVLLSVDFQAGDLSYFVVEFK